MSSNDNETPASPASSGPPRPLGIAIRILLPIGLVAVGLFGYSKLSVKEPPPAPPRPAPKPTETRVHTLLREDYQVFVPSQGTIRPHSQVGLTAQVSGRVQTIRPAFEEGAFFKQGEILLELDPIDFDVALVAAKSQLAQAQLNLKQEEARAEQALLDWKDLGHTNEPNELVRREPQLQAAEQALKLAEAQHASALRDRERARVKAPFDGRVLTRTVGVGQTIGAATSLGEVFATDYSEVRLPVSSKALADLSLPEDITDPPLSVLLQDGLTENPEVEWEAKILRTEGALDAETLELFAIARIEDPYGIASDKVPLRVRQPVTARIPGRILENVFVIPREAVSSLSRIRLVDPNSLRLGSARIMPLHSDEENIIFRDDAIPEGTLLATTRLVYAPDGGEVVIIKDDLEPGEGGDADTVTKTTKPPASE